MPTGGVVGGRRRCPAVTTTTNHSMLATVSPQLETKAFRGCASAEVAKGPNWSAPQTVVLTHSLPCRSGSWRPSGASPRLLSFRPAAATPARRAWPSPESAGAVGGLCDYTTCLSSQHRAVPAQTCSCSWPARVPKLGAGLGKAQVGRPSRTAWLVLQGANLVNPQSLASRSVPQLMPL